MNWLLQFLADLGRVGQRHPKGDVVAVLRGADVLSDFRRLTFRLQLLYVLWAALALSFIVTGLYALWLTISSVWPSPAAATILLVGGIGLLYECLVGIELDARR